MSMQLFGDNRKSQIEGNVTFEAEDFLIADPGSDACSARFFKMRLLEFPIRTDGFYSQILQVADAPDFGSNQYALPFLAGMDYHVVEKEEFAWNDSFVITHADDPEGKRYVEAWVNYYPTTGYSPTFVSGTYMLPASDMFFKVPKVYPDIVQEITLPSGCDYSTFLSYISTDTPYQKIRLSEDGDTLCIWGGTRALIYEWNSGNTEYDLVYDFNDVDCSEVYAAATKNGKCVISYYDTNRVAESLAYIEKSGTWSLVGKYDNPNANRNKPIHLRNPFGSAFYIVIGACYSNAATYNYDDRSLVYDSETDPNADDYRAFSAYPNHQAYDLNGETVYNINTAYWTVLGGPVFQEVSYAKYEANARASYWPSSDYFTGQLFSTGASNNNAMVTSYGTVMMADLTDIRFLVNSTEGELCFYPYLDAFKESARWYRISQSQEYYIFNKYLAGAWNFQESPAYSYMVWAYKEDEPIKLELYDKPTHKIYPQDFYPVKPPYFLTNPADDTRLLLLEIGMHYTEYTPAQCTLRIDTPNAITTTTDFTFPTMPPNTDAKFLLSWDDVTYYKYTTSWVVESDPANGSTLAQFQAGCQAGLAAPADCYTAYIKMDVTVTDDDSPFEIPYTDVKLWLTTISTVNNMYMCDDSKVKIEHISDTETRITSLMGQNVIISVHLCVVAPPYNVRYED